jgi:ATP-binding cassette subfamily A (ABC1) protein 1/ATP-binding cassette subfamily A (ABC1) protein 3
VRALQRLNGLFFITGYLGFLATWVLDAVLAFAPGGGGGAAAARRALGAALGAASPHYLLARGVYSVARCYHGGGLAGVAREAQQAQQDDDDPFAWGVAGGAVARMAAQGTGEG